MVEFKINKNLILKGWVIKRPNIKKTRKWKIPNAKMAELKSNTSQNIIWKRLNDKMAKSKKDLMPKWSNLIKILKSMKNKYEKGQI
jgi:hypothetical protein